MRLYITFIYIAFFTNITFASKNYIVQKAQKVYVDVLGNIYLQNNAEIIKYNKDLKIVSRYSNTNLNAPSFIDVQNPMRTLLHYNLQSKFIMLDWMLAPINIENNYKTEFATLMCNSINNGFWIYNQTEPSITRYDDRWIVAAKINNLNNVINNFIPNVISESNNQLFMYDENYGYVILNTIGSIIKKIPIQNIQHHEVFDGAIYYKNKLDNCFYSLKLDNLTQKKISEPFNNNNVFFTKENIYTIKSDTLFINSINND